MQGRPAPAGGPFIRRRYDRCRGRAGSPDVGGGAASGAHILERLKRRYPEAGTALEYRAPWQLLVATVLSAQTTDANVNRVTPGLFARWPTPRDLAAADPAEVEAAVYSTGYYRQKARAVIALSADLVERFGGEVPVDLGALTSLRGWGARPPAWCWPRPSPPAIAVDTHVVAWPVGWS